MRRLILLAAALACAGCGYRLVEGRHSLGDDVRAIEIEIFQNRSSEAGFELLVAHALSEEFARRGRLEPRRIGQGAAGTVRMTGVLHEVHVRAGVYSSIGLSVEDNLRVAVGVRIQQPGTGALLWERSELVFEERFLTSPDPQVYDSRKEQAMRRLSSALARRIHDELLER